MSYLDVKYVKLMKKRENFESKLIYVQKQLPLAKTPEEEQKYVSQIIELNEEIDKIIKELVEVDKEYPSFYMRPPIR